jgi:hypothetical protein
MEPFLMEFADPSLLYTGLQGIDYITPFLSTSSLGLSNIKKNEPYLV